MSLDVTLYGAPEDVECRECGHIRPIKTTLYDANITHNLNKMAEAAGIYKHLWRPEEIGISTARQLIEPLRAGIALMDAKPVWFRLLDSPNGWGTYDNFLPWLRKYLAACEEYPDAEVSVNR